MRGTAQEIPEISPWRFPSTTERMVIVGRTGSGKTQFGSFILSEAAFDRMPYIITDYKGDELLNSIPGLQQLSIRDKLPKKPGLYIVHPIARVDDEAYEDFLWRVRDRENIGMYFDEGYRVPDKTGAFEALLTEGRSKQIPAIVLSQRPAWISRFVFSEANIFTVFHLNHDKDKQKIGEMLPKHSMKNRLERYNSIWYDVDHDELLHLTPAPSADEIRARFASRLAPGKTRFI